MTMIESGKPQRFDASALPTFAPDPALRARILASHAKQQQSRRVRFAVGSGALAASLALVAVMLVHRGPTAPLAETASAAQVESRGLELEWQQSTRSGSAITATPRLRAIDAQLQSAYDRGADAREVSALWARRNAALRQLIQASSDGIVAADDSGMTRL